MPLGRSPRVPRRGAPPGHAATCGPAAAGGPPTHYATTAIVSGVAWLLYWSTLDADFAYDDSRAIKTNQDLIPASPVTSLFRNDFWGTPLTHSGSHKSYRPMCVLSFRMNYALGGLDPWGYHLTNVILHALVSAVFTRLAAYVFLQHALPTLVAGLLFAAHPIHTEAVAGVVGRADVGACLFFLLCIVFYVRYCECRDREPELYARRWLYLYSSLLCATLSMLTKEHGVTVLAVCIVYDILINNKVSLRNALSLAFEKRYRGVREGVLHVVGTAVTLLGLRLHLMGSKLPDFAPADNPAADSDSFLTRTLTFLYLPAFNFWLLLCPRWLSFDWSMEAIPLMTSTLDVRNLASVCFYMSLLAIICWIFKSLNRRGQSCDSAFSSSSSCAALTTANGSGPASNSANSAVSSGRNTAGLFCPCLGITQRLALMFSSNSNKTYRKHTSNSLNNNCSQTYNSYTNGHRVSNGNGHYHAPLTSGNSSHNGFATHFYTENVSDSRRFCSNGTAMWTPFASPSDVVMFSLALMILPFIPATNLFFYVGFVIAERVLYIPSMGFCLLVALGVDLMYRWQESILRKRALMTAFLGLLVVMSARTIRRNSDWLSEENLYRSGIQVNPPKAYGNLANILSGQGKKAEAEWAYKKALSYRSNMADVRYNLGILLQEQGRYEEALHSYKLAIQFRPRLAMAHLNMGLVLGILGRKEEAAEVYRHCAELDSTGLKDPKMHESTRISALFNLGRLYADEGKYHEAMEIYYEAVHKMPEHYQPQSLYNMMGEAFFKMGQFVEAEHWYREALRVKPDHIPAHLTYAKLLSKWNRLEEAEEWFLKAKTLAPNDSSVYQHYGQFLSECERHSEAAEIYVRAAELAADEYEIIFNAANTLRQAGRNAEAENYYQLAVKLRPNEVTSHMNLGAMLHVNGKLLEAEMSYLEALRLKPDDPITQNNLQKLRNLLVQKGLRSSNQSRR